MSKHFRLGVLINPYAGIGGALALKGSDGKEIREQALSAGAEKLAGAKMARALKLVEPLAEHVQVVTAAGEMGEDICQQAGLNTTVVFTPEKPQTEAEDTEAAVNAMLASGIDLLLFAGGDGTARNVCGIAWCASRL